MRTEVLPEVPESVLLDLDRKLGEHVPGCEGPVLAPRVLPAAVYDEVPHETLRVWCHLRAFYGLPTVEAVEWLRRFIRGRSAIEVGASHGVFGTALGLPVTDSFVQEDPEVVAYSQALGQPCVRYAARVEKLDALAAAKKYRPKVVFGSWVTQRGVEGDACMFGVREDQILARSHVEAYVVYGSRSAHLGKNIAGQTPKGWRFRVETHPGFRSRSASPAIMLVWTRA